MTTWQYYEAFLDALAPRRANLNRLGAEGWELVAVDGPRYTFKRPVVEQSSEADAKSQEGGSELGRCDALTDNGELCPDAAVAVVKAMALCPAHVSQEERNGG